MRVSGCSFAKIYWNAKPAVAKPAPEAKRILFLNYVEPNNLFAVLKNELNFMMA